MSACTINYDCTNNGTDVTQGCCGGFCLPYTDAACVNVANRPLQAICVTNNTLCKDSCCGRKSQICVPPYEDCAGQLPLLSFLGIVCGSMLVLGVLYYIVELLRRKNAKEKLQKK